MGTTIQSTYGDLRGQLIVMLILAVAIALRSQFTGDRLPRTSVPTFPTSTSVQQDVIHHNDPSPSQSRVSLEPQCRFKVDALQPDARQEWQE